MKGGLSCSVLALFLVSALLVWPDRAGANAGNPLLVEIELAASEDVYRLDELGLPLLEAGEGWALARLTPQQVSRACGAGFPVAVLEPFSDRENYFLVRPLTEEARQVVQAADGVLFTDGRDLLLRTSGEMPVFSTGQVMLKRVSGEPLKLHTLSAPVEVPLTADPLVQRLVSEVSEDSVRVYIQRLRDFRTRYSPTDSADAAARYLADHFRSSGLDSVYFQHFYSDYSDNVIATLPGILEPRKVYLICSHYDSYTFSNPYYDAPGADDNASGTACVLEAARVCAPMRFRYTLKFVAFSGEEEGLYGSDYYAQQAAAAGDSILGVLNFDMIGYLDDSRWDLEIIYNSSSSPLADFAYASAQTYVPSLTPLKIYDPYAYYSDHASFWDAGFSALCDIEHDGTRTNPYIHTTGDVIATLTMPFAAACARYGVAALAGLGVPDTTEYVSITLDPDTTVVHPGGTLGFAGTMTNNTGQARTVQTWTEATLPDGYPYPGNPVLGPTSVTLAPHQTLRRHFLQRVPLSTRPGAYTYCGQVGTYPSDMDESCFRVTVAP